MRKIKVMMLSALLIGSLAACATTNDTPEVPENPPANGSDVETPENETPDDGESPASDETEGGTQNPDDPDVKVERPETIDLEVVVEGMAEQRTAHLAVSELNYSMYVLEGFTLDAEEPGRDVLLLDYDDEFFVRIQPLGNEADVKEIENQIIVHAQGSVEAGYNVPLTDVEYAILEMVDATAIVHVGKNVDGHFVKYTLFLPSKEAAEGAEPSFWAMLETLSVDEL